MFSMSDLMDNVEDKGYKVLLLQEKRYQGMETLLIFNDDQFIRWSFPLNLLEEDIQTIEEQIFVVLLRFTPVNER